MRRGDKRRSHNAGDEFLLTEDSTVEEVVAAVRIRAERENGVQLDYTEAEETVRDLLESRQKFNIDTEQVATAAVKKLCGKSAVIGAHGRIE